MPKLNMTKEESKSLSIFLRGATAAEIINAEKKVFGNDKDRIKIKHLHDISKRLGSPYQGEKQKSNWPFYNKNKKQNNKMQILIKDVDYKKISKDIFISFTNSVTKKRGKNL